MAVTDYGKLSDRELDAKCAEYAVPGSKAWNINGEWHLRRCSPWRPVPPYSTDLNAARELEEEIKRRGLENQYSDAIFDVVAGKTGASAWHYLHASARDRAIAFCMCMEAANAEC